MLFWLPAVFLGLIIVVGILAMMPVHVEVDVSMQGAALKGTLRVWYLFKWLELARSFGKVEASTNSGGISMKHSTKVTKPGRNHRKQHRVLSVKDFWDIALKFWHWRALLKNEFSVLRWTLKRLNITLFRTEVELGTNDASQTGVAIGAGYGALYSMAGYVQTHFHCARKPEVHLTPDFSKAVFHLRQQCIFEIRLGYAIWAAARSLLIWMKRGTQHGTSHSGTHANSHE